MSTLIFYHTVLVLHITGLVMLAGTVLVDYVLANQFWKQYAIDKQKGLAVCEAMLKLQRLPAIGGILLILSGITMMVLTHGAYGGQTWFRIKMVLVILIIINAIAFRRRQGVKLSRLLVEKTPRQNMDAELLKVKSNLRLFHLSQNVLLITIFVLSVFKFN